MTFVVNNGSDTNDKNWIVPSSERCSCHQSTGQSCTPSTRTASSIKQKSRSQYEGPVKNSQPHLTDHAHIQKHFLKSDHSSEVIYYTPFIVISNLSFIFRIPCALRKMKTCGDRDLFTYLPTPKKTRMLGLFKRTIIPTEYKNKKSFGLLRRS